MARYRKSKANTKNFQVIPKHHELEDDDFLKRKYSGKRVLTGTVKKYKCPNCGTETFEGDMNHRTVWHSKGSYCVVGGKRKGETNGK